MSVNPGPRTDSILEIPTRSALLPQQPESVLAGEIVIGKPGDIAKKTFTPDPLELAPNGVTFERSVAIEPDWSEVSDQSMEDWRFIKEYFTRSWAQTPIPAVGIVSRYSKSDPDSSFLPLYRVTLPDQSTLRDQPSTISSTPTLTELSPGEYVVQHGSSQRRYVLLGHFPPNDASAFPEDNWSRVTGVELLYRGNVISNEGSVLYRFPVFEIVDLSPRALVEKAALLKAEYELAKKLDVQADKLLESTPLAGLEASDIDAFGHRFSLLKMRLPDVTASIARLMGQAGQLGYILVPHTDFNSSNVPDADGRLDSLPALFQSYTDTYQWTTIERVTAGRKFPGVWKERTADITVTHSRNFTNFAKVDSSRDQTGDRVRVLQNGTKSTFNPLERKYRVFEFERTPRGYWTAQGDSLESVMARCDGNEEFRCSCAIVLPVYDASVTSRPVKLRSVMIRHPLPGILPQSRPGFFLQEKLASRIAWVGAELGQLLESVGLAPGEKRKITVSRTRESEYSTTRTTNSLLDVTETRSIDLTTELENEVRSDRTHAFATSHQATGSYEYGPYKVSGTATTNYNYTKTEARRDFARTVRKVSESVARRRRLEVTLGSSSKLATKEAETTEYQFENINDGRTLNLLFYQVNNAFRAGLYVNGLSFLYDSGVELVQGTGVRQLQSFEADRLMEFLDAIGPKDAASGEAGVFRHPSFLIALEGDANATYHSSLRTQVVKKLIRVLIDEFGPDTDAVSALSNEVVNDLYRIASSYSASDDDEDKLQQRVKYVAEKANGTLLGGKPETVMVPSQAVYLDSLLGANPATERYSEEMRAQEVRMRAAEVVAKVSGSCRTQFGHAGCGSPFLCWDLVDTRRIVHFDVRQQEIHIRLTDRLAEPVEEWSLWIGHNRIGQLADAQQVVPPRYKVSLSTNSISESTDVQLRQVYLLHSSGRVILT